MVLEPAIDLEDVPVDNDEMPSLSDQRLDFVPTHERILVTVI
jgi:hypothetical protein